MHEEATVDHIVPRSRGGVNQLHNAQLLCLFCHRLKSFDEQKEHLAHARLGSTLLAVAISKGFNGACKCFHIENHAKRKVYMMLSGCPMKDMDHHLANKQPENGNGIELWMPPPN